MKIFSGSSNKPLAQNIARSLDLDLSSVEVHVFPDGERRIKIDDNVLDEEVVIVQSTSMPVDQSYVELFFIIDALKRSGAKKITAIIPYLGYQRQDHVFREGEAVSLKVMIKILESLKVDKVVALDFHSIKIPEFFSIDLSHISALSIFASKIKNLLDDNRSVLVSPDMGGLRRIQQISTLLDAMPWIATVKNRDLNSGEIEISDIDYFDSGLNKADLAGRTAFIIDDMASSGGTLMQAADLLKKNGVGEIYAFVTHAIFSDDAPVKLQNSNLKKIYVTDSVLVPDNKQFDKLVMLSIGDDLAAAI